jgi:hypothetical protein
VIRREEHIVKQTRSYRYPGAEADHAIIIIHPGAAADGGVPESFCAYHAARGVDVWRRELNPELQTLDSWLAQHNCEIPLD